MTDNSAPHFTPEGTSPQGDASFGAHVWGFFAGIISSIGYVQIFGGGLIGVTLAYVCLLPLYWVGLSAGRKAVVTATVFGIIGTLLQTMAANGFAITILYAAVFGVPAMVTSRVALIKINDAYVTGSAVLLTLLTIGCVLILGSAGALAAGGVDLQALIASVADSYTTVMREADPSLTEPQLEQVKAMMSNSLPGLMALSWLVIHALNFAIAQWASTQTGKALRAAPKISNLELPGYMAPIMVIGAAAGASVAGSTGIVLGAVGMLLGAGFTLVGLAIMHALMLDVTTKRGWSRTQQNMLLAFYYIVFLALQLPLLLALALGLLDPWVRFRRKLIKA